MQTTKLVLQNLFILAAFSEDSSNPPLSESKVSFSEQDEKKLTTKACRVLVIDDEVPIQRLMKNFLEFLSCDVDVCSEGKSGLEILKTKQYDLIFLDIILPGLNGVEVLREIKSQKIPTSVCMMTGYASEDYIKEALQLGALACLKKPFDLVKIREILAPFIQEEKKRD